MSSRGYAVDIAIAAVILSVAAHVGLMLYVRSHVMTHVSTRTPARVRRAPMTVREAKPPAEAVRLELVKDVAARREAPSAGENASPAPAPDDLDTRAAGETAMPAAGELPDIITHFATEEIPQMATEDSPTVAAPPASVRMDSEIAVLPGTDALAERAPQPAASAIAAPAIALPASPALEHAPAVASARITPDPRATARPAFIPTAEVYDEVDEKTVETEKMAVRDLLHDEDAADLTKAVLAACTSHFDGTHTYFRVNLAPMAALPTVPKDLVILIDASGSIGDDRLASCRKAARAILRSCTNTGDRFNLVAFRDRFSYCFRSWQACNAASFAAGDKWLVSLAAHGRTDVFSTIRSVLTLPRDPKRPLIALVVTDGDANEGVSDTAQILSRFSTLNDGLVSVYMYGVKSSANRELIDVLTHGNRGESFIFDGWRWNAGNGIEGLSERFRDPVLTDMRLVWSARTMAESYPMRLKNLYRGDSVSLVGRVKGRPAEIAFSLRGLSGAKAWEGYFTLPLRPDEKNRILKSDWEAELRLDLKIR